MNCRASGHSGSLLPVAIIWGPWVSLKCVGAASRQNDKLQCNHSAQTDITEGDVWMVRSAGRLLCAAAAILASLSICRADPPPPADGGTIEPEVTGIGAKISIAGERYIAIHRQSRNQNVGPVIHYFHRPLFILKTNSHPIAGYPPIVLGTPRTIGEKAYIQFGLILNTPQFQEDARGFVIENDPELKQPGSRVSLNDIRVDGWPIMTLIIKLVEPLSNAVIGEWISPSLGEG
jgi:hypothetical protein